MAKIDKVVVWKKWIDPFDDNEFESDEEFEDVEEDNTELDDKPTPNNNSGPVLVGPMGVIPLNEHNMPSKVFNFWMGHTNFDLGIEQKNILDRVPGVETLEIFTRYRFRISIGVAFEQEEVLRAIENSLAPTEQQTAPFTTQKVNSVDKLKTRLSSHYKYWAIFILPNGEIDYQTGDTQDSVKEKIAKYPNKADVLTSWEVNDEGGKKNGNGRGISTSTR
jgi:hypothetical protein